LVAARLVTEVVVPKLILRTRRRRGPGQKKKRSLSADDAIDLTPTKKNNHLCKGKSALTKEIFPLAKKPKVSRRSSGCSNFEVSLQSDVEPVVGVVRVVYIIKSFCVFARNFDSRVPIIFRFFVPLSQFLKKTQKNCDFFFVCQSLKPK